MPVPKTEVLITVAGAEHGRLVVEPGEYLIGRNPECAIKVEADLVSRLHAKLTLNFDNAFIEDLGSSHGTQVNGQPVAGNTRLWPNQKIQVGAATIELHRIKTPSTPDMTVMPTQEVVNRMLPEELLREKKYDIGGVVAQGGMGAILDAREAAIKRKVAMKVMLDGNNPDDLARFIAEAQVTGQLEHPNIVPVHELGVDENRKPFYTMKFLKGITFKKVLELLAEGVEATVKKYTLTALLTVFQKVCDAVAFAHSKGVLHRDLKPENIMIGEYGEVLLMDWGLAKVLDSTRAPSAVGDLRSIVQTAAGQTGSMTLAGTVMGTPQFMSPEQARGEVDTLDARSDLYSLGAILRQILTLQPPVEGRNVHEVLEKVGKGEFTSPLAAVGSKRLPHLPAGRVPESLNAVVMKAMALQREDRYPSVLDLQQEIEAYQHGFATSAEKAGFVKQAALLVKRHRGIFITGFVAWFFITALLAWFVVNVTRERNRTARTLHQLRGTAPTFTDQSRALLADGKLADALAKIGYAVELAPDDADYRLARANLFQSTQKLAEAADEYRHVLALRPSDPTARENLDLCEKLLTETGGSAELPLNLQGKLLDALIAQHRDLEAAPLAKLLNRDTQTAGATILARLASYTTQKGWKKERIRVSGKGFFVDLGGLQLGDLNALHGLPIVVLSMYQTSVTDLRPLAGLPLESLDLKSTRVSDLSPLRGMKLRTLNMYGTDVTDLSPLAGMPLKELDISQNFKLRSIAPLAGLPLEKLTASNVTITDLSPLRGMPLRELNLHHEKGGMPDSSPIAHSPTLEKIGLPWNISDIAFLSKLPKLQQVDFHAPGKSETLFSVHQFLAMYGPEVPEIKATRAALTSVGIKDLPIRKLAVDPDHHIRLDLASAPLTDLAPLRGIPINDLNLSGVKVSSLEPLRGMPIKKLNIHSSDVSDLGPLRGMPINVLVIGHTKVRDLEPLRDMPLNDLSLGLSPVSNLEPLRGMPLVKLNLRGSPIRDASILADFHELEELVLPEKATNIERLRTLPKLRYISTAYDSVSNRPAQTAAQFWKEYDAQKAAPK